MGERLRSSATTSNHEVARCLVRGNDFGNACEAVFNKVTSCPYGDYRFVGLFSLQR